PAYIRIPYMLKRGAAPIQAARQVQRLRTIISVCSSGNGVATYVYLTPACAAPSGCIMADLRINGDSFIRRVLHDLLSKHFFRRQWYLSRSKLPFYLVANIGLRFAQEIG